MLKAKIPISGVLIVVIIALHQVDGRQHIYKKLDPFPTQQVSYHQHYSFENGRLLYALCDEYPSGYRCQVRQHKSPFENAKYTCNVTLDFRAGPVVYHSSVIVIAFGEDKALLTWADGSSNKFLTLHMSECRQSKTFEVDGQNGISNNLEWLLYRQIVTYNDTYDVFFQNYGNLLRVNVDAEGNSNRSTFFADYGYNLVEVGSIYSAEQRSPAKGYVYMKYSGLARFSSTLYLFRSNGSEKLLMGFKRPQASYVMSTAHDTIGVCARDYPSALMGIRCSQFDLDGRSTVVANLTDKLTSLQPKAMHNLPAGGFLLLLVEYDNIFGFYSAPVGYHVMKIDAAGRKLGEQSIEGYREGKGHDAIHIWEKSNGKQYCVLIFRIDSYIVNCFTDDDFQIQN